MMNEIWSCAAEDRCRSSISGMSHVEGGAANDEPMIPSMETLTQE